MEQAEENTGDWQRRVASNQVVQIPMPASHREKTPEEMMSNARQNQGRATLRRAEMGPRGGTTGWE